MSGWVRPVGRGWVVTGDVPGPDVDEFAEPDRVIAALARPGAAGRTLLAVQHPHRTPAAIARGLSLPDALPDARATLRALTRLAYRPVADVVAPYEVDGPDGSAVGLLCMVDPAAVDGEGVGRVRHSERVYPEVVAERAEVLAGLGMATSAAMLVPVVDGDSLTASIRSVIALLGAAAVSTVDSGGRRHRLWVVGFGPLREELLAAASRSPLMVADGNHRVAAAKDSGLLALVTAGPDLRIGAFHRFLVGTGLDSTALVTAWRRIGLDVRDAPDAPAPTAPGTVVVRCRDRTVVVDLPSSSEPGPHLDHATVERLLIRTALDLDPGVLRPLPVGREAPAEAEAVLLLAPVPLPDALAVHAAGRRMPRKSTYFTPKPRSGLLLAELDPA